MNRTIADSRDILVWIDANEAVILRWTHGDAIVEHIGSDVPRSVRSTGQVRHAPGIRHGGGAVTASAERHRAEHLTRFVAGIADRLPPDADVTIVGPGRVRDQLRRRLDTLDHGRPQPRRIASGPADRETDRQLVARLRVIVDAAPARRQVGVTGRLTH